MSPSPTKRGPGRHASASDARTGKPVRRTKAQADIRVTSFMGSDFAVCQVREPSGQTAQWLLPVSILPASARPTPPSEVRFMHGDHVLYTQSLMPAPVRVPFYRLLQAKRRGKARRT